MSYAAVCKLLVPPASFFGLQLLVEPKFLQGHDVFLPSGASELCSPAPGLCKS